MSEKQSGLDEMTSNHVNHIAHSEGHQSHQRCAALRNTCHSCTLPMRTKYNPLPSDAGQIQICKYFFMCPPHGRLAEYWYFIVLFFVSWAVLISITGSEGLPGGNFFSLAVLFFACNIGGYLTVLIRLPPLLGMLIIGCCLRNVPVLNIVGMNLNNQWSSAFRQIALTVILIRAGLGLDARALRRLSCVVVRLAFSPCLAECFAEAILAHFLLGFPWVWGIMLGFVLAAVSPAVVVPSLLNLAEKGYGLNKGIPTLVIAAASIDDVIAITGFGVTLGIAFSDGDLALSIFKGPFEAIVGILYGIIGGIFIWYIPNRDSCHVVLYRTILLFGLGLMATFGSSKLEYPGAGPLGVLTMAFVAGMRWKKEDWSKFGDNPINGIVAMLWLILQPLLFGLIGAEVDIIKIDPGSIGLGIATLALGLVVRLSVSFLVMFGTDLNLKEKLFIPFAWLPKATVQAAIGALALDKAREMGNKENAELGKQVLTLAVLSIILTAPLGAIAIAVCGPHLLHQTVDDQQIALTANGKVTGENTRMLLEEKANDYHGDV